MGKIKGLNKQEVAKRISEGKVNLSPKPVVKSNFQIIMGHVFNLFNAYNFIIAAALIAVQAYSSFICFSSLSFLLLLSFQILLLERDKK